MYSLFLLFVCYWLSLERGVYWGYIMRAISIQCLSNLIFVPSHKSLDPMMNIYDGHNYDLKTRVDLWMSKGVVPLE